jgi:DNA repair photolyase
MLPRPISNPPNPWLSTEVEYLDEIPPAELEVYEDHTREILSHNDSPDVGFSWSVNPYRGCFHACAYCLSGDTPILMGDGTTLPLADVRVGQVIYGTVARGRYRRYVRTPVLAHWQTTKRAFRISLEDGTTLIASGDHRFLTERGWKYVSGKMGGPDQRPHLTIGNSLLGIGKFAPPPDIDVQYKIEEVMQCLGALGFDAVLEPGNSNHRASNVRVRGGLREHLRFFHTVGPCITRKRDIEGQAVKSAAKLGVVRVEALGIEMPMYDITTGTGDFIANGVISHNCYARPTHEYLGLGAGTDFERKITVKPQAPQLLREAFERPSWKGELVVFSGVTDCYQPLEASYRLTRGCLEVCAEYRNPAGIITKSPLIERDLDVLQQLQKEARLSVSVSIPVWDRGHAHAIEPYVATPQRRMKTIERLAAAGLDVGVNVAPVIPGLSDADIPRILEAAHAAGARRAGFVFLRLPGSVKQVFEQRLRESLPLRADRVLNRVRDARGGKLYDSRWGVRGRGEGTYAEAARALFDATVKRLRMNEGFQCDLQADTFRRPGRASQLPLL